MFWTETQDSALREALSAKLSFTRIATQLCKSTGAIAGRAKRLGIVFPENYRTTQMMKARGWTGQTSRRPALAEITLRCVEIVPRNISLIELENGDCRYPYGDEIITFCGHPQQEGSSYCAAHHFLCLAPPQPKRDRYFRLAA